MSPKILSFHAGLTALGLGLSALAFAVAEEPDAPGAPQAVSASEADHAPTGQDPAEGTPSVLLLSNGRVFEGEVTESDSGYTVRNRFGEVRFRRGQVEKTFGSIREVYQYKLARLPGRDPAEHLKLAQWCLSQKMRDEASEQLEAVLALSPDHKQATAMLFQLRSIAEHGPGRTGDDAVVRTGAEIPGDPSSTRRASAAGEEPAPLSLDALRDAAARNPGAMASMPVILDLPTALAVKRYQEFGRSVHQVLQQACAKCHNENSSGSFKLIRARSRRDMSNELLVRYNLDSTLRLVDVNDLSHSALLTSALMPHRPNGQPVLIGPNDPRYRALATWVAGLRVEQTEPEDLSTGSNAGGLGFATERLGERPRPSGGPESDLLVPRPQVPDSGAAVLLPGGGLSIPPTNLGEAHPTPPGQILSQVVPGAPAVGMPEPPPPSAFPTSPLLGGPNPAKVGVRGVRGANGKPGVVTTRLPQGNAPPPPPLPRGNAPIDRAQAAAGAGNPQGQPAEDADEPPVEGAVKVYYPGIGYVYEMSREKTLADPDAKEGSKDVAKSKGKTKGRFSEKDLTKFLQQRSQPR